MPDTFIYLFVIMVGVRQLYGPYYGLGPFGPVVSWARLIPAHVYQFRTGIDLAMRLAA